MKSTVTPNCSSRASATHLMLVAALAIAPRAFPQTVPSPATAEQLAKYDKNKNGTLEAAERNALEADEAASTRAPAGPPVPDDTITLSPFEVTTEKDDGFAASSAGTGGRLATNMEDIAAPFSAMTRDFIDAMGITNLVEAGTWSVNGAPIFDGQGVDMFGNPNLTNIRGQGTSQSGQRNYSFTASILDSYNLERYEFGRGPNAALFNISNGNSDNPLVGGQSATTKRARFDRPFDTISFAAGSWDYYRATLDVNRPLTKRLAVRTNAVWFDREGWRLNEFEKTKGVTVAGTYRLGKMTELRLEGSAEITERSQPVTLVMDKLSGWDGSTVFSSPITDAALAAFGTTGAANRGVERRAGQYYVWVPGQGMIMNRQNEGLTMRGDENANVPFYTGGVARFRGTGLPFGNGGNNNGGPDMNTNPGNDLWFLGQENLPADRFDRAISNSAFRLPSRRFTYLPEFPVFEQHNKDVNGAFTHQFTKTLIAEVGFDFNKTHDARMQDANTPRFTRIDINQNLPDGTPNPYFLQPYGDMGGRLADRYTETRMVRFNLGWLKDVGKWGLYQVVVNASTNSTSVKDRNRLISMADVPDARLWDSGSLRVNYRFYWKNPDRPYNRLGDLPGTLSRNIYNTNNTLQSTALTPAQPRWVLSGGTDNERINSSISVPVSATYSVFKKKLVVMAVPRFDQYNSKVNNGLATADLPANWDGTTLFFKPKAPADWLNLTYVSTDANTLAPLTRLPATSRPRTNTTITTVNNTNLQLALPVARYTNDRFRDDYSAPDNKGHRYTGSYGAVYHILPWVSVAGNYATNYGIPPTNTFTINNEQVAAREGRGMDLSLRFHLAKGKLTVNTNYFHNEADRARVGSPIVGSANTLLQQQTATNTVADGRNERGIPDFFTNDYQSVWSKGYELEVVGKIGRSVRVMINGGSSESAVFDRYPLSKAWIKIWDPALQLVLQDAGGMLSGGPQPTGAPGLAINNPAITPASATDRNNAVSAYNSMWANYANTVLTADSGRQNVVTLYKANFYVDYTVPRTWLKNLRVGVGVQWRGGHRANVAGDKRGQTTLNAAGQVVDDPNVDSFSNVYIYQPVNTTLTLGYKAKLFGKPVDFQLNVRNLINEQAVIYQDSGITLRPPGGDVNVPYRVATASRVADYQQPISFIFKTTVTF
jgi:hypothetical protein